MNVGRTVNQHDASMTCKAQHIAHEAGTRVYTQHVSRRVAVLRVGAGALRGFGSVTPEFFFEIFDARK